MTTIVTSPPRPSTVLRAAIARARRRMRQRRFRQGLLVVTVLAAAGFTLIRVAPSNPASRPQSPRPTTTPVLALATIPDVGAMGLIAPGVGWAANGVHLYLTLDDGAHWTMLRSPLLEGNVLTHLGGFASIGRDNLWFGAIGRGYGSCVDRGPPGTPGGGFLRSEIEYTSDGGAHWGTATLPGCSTLTGLDFIDASHGWAFGASGSGGSVYATTDGGTQWRTVASLPVRATLGFANVTDGWASSATGQVLHTTNGGTSWAAVTMPLPPRFSRDALALGAPRFFGASGVIAATATTRDSLSFIFFSTANGGATWTADVVPRTSSLLSNAINLGDLPAVDPTAVASATVWTADLGSALYRTADGGHSWQEIRPSRPWQPDAVALLTFSSASYGWAIQRSSSIWGDGSLSFLATSDGGTTWQTLAKV